MVYRKGELSKAAIDREWPHQVALPVVSDGRGVQRDHGVLREACRCARAAIGFGVTVADYVVKCFATREDADKFAARFNGEYMTPETRPSWIEKPKAK